MAVPFRRTSSKKKKQRHTVSNLNLQKRATSTLVKCNNCQQVKKPHRICPACLTYRSAKYLV
ncbi:MAG: 50S ribosomal protein L32 [Mycoplasmataceae bacterium CE_OT135]|nr:MAG: 50S ribosomal protein L32 [Mycoplasmataceae bacterium CE_OT135]